MAHDDPLKPRTGRTVLIVIAIVVAACCLCGGVIGLWAYNGYRDSAGPAREATTAFVDDVLAGRYESAYGRMCERARNSITQEEFTRIQSAQLKVTGYEISGVTVSTFNGRTQAAVTAQMTQETGAAFTQTFPLIKEDGEWRVCQ
ncbi:DUF4878 domain-containing protein [Micromonospora sp. CPCC 205371]|nr:DUF4878 domain-containing protein [Micromonospora sp. CPCC 205371]